MKVTYENYKNLLPERLYKSFVSMVDRAYGRAIVYSSGLLKFEES